MSSYLLTVATPDGNCFKGDVVFLSLRGTEGDLAIMAGHAPFVTAVLPCTLHLETEAGEDLYGKTEGGLLAVSPEGVSLLLGSYEPVEHDS